MTGIPFYEYTVHNLKNYQISMFRLLDFLCPLAQRSAKHTVGPQCTQSEISPRMWPDPPREVTFLFLNCFYGSRPERLGFLAAI